MNPYYFNFENTDKEQTKTLILRNTSKKDIVFKVRQSCPLSVRVKNHVGAIKRGHKQNIEITLNESFSKIQSSIDKIYLDIYCLDINKINFKARRGWLYSDDETVSQLCHRFMIRKTTADCPRRMVVDLPARASLIEPILIPIDYYTEADTKTCRAIDEDFFLASPLEWKDKLIYHPKTGTLFNNDQVMKSHIRVPSERVVSKIMSESGPKVIDRQNASFGLIQGIAKFLFPPAEDNLQPGNVGNDVTGPIDLKADVTTYKAHDRVRKRGTIGICGV
uniref:Major sperm protein n=1 Tax=Parastrongyloides trichosuri TaxID=131310 RepID=A0A0N4ZSV8_PARTI